MPRWLTARRRPAASCPHPPPTQAIDVGPGLPRRPSSIVYTPMFAPQERPAPPGAHAAAGATNSTTNASAPTVYTGFTSLVYSWDQVVTQALPRLAPGRNFHVILSSPEGAGRTVAILVSGGQFAVVGDGRLHDEGQPEKYAYSFPLGVDGANITVTVRR